jgi:Reverse transcriptase (RNA-dependent DNA polymerase)
LLIHHFKNLYKETASANTVDVLLQHFNINLPIISTVDNARLQCPSTMEIFHTLGEMGLDRAPGPDGIIVRLLRREWGIMGPQVVEMIKGAFLTGNIPNSWTTSNLVLIPKIDHPTKPTHFRPLSVCSVYYRLFTKLIANRVKPLLSTLVSPNQAAFLKGRSIQENVLLLQEVMHSFLDKEYKEKAFALKADLYKAFDCLNWNYLNVLLRELGFPNQL